MSESEYYRLKQLQQLQH